MEKRKRQASDPFSIPFLPSFLPPPPHHHHIAFMSFLHCHRHEAEYWPLRRETAHAPIDPSREAVRRHEEETAKMNSKQKERWRQRDRRGNDTGR